MKTKLIAAVAVVVAAGMLTSCLPNDDTTPLIESETGKTYTYTTVDAPLAAGVPDPALHGATPDGWQAIVDANPGVSSEAGASATGSHCPSVRDPQMPPCTQSAGNTGMYGNAAYLCVVGVGKIWGLQFGSLRTCMDAALVNRSDTITPTSVFFYEADLYKYWRYAQENLTHWWQLVAIFKAWWVANATLLATPWVCSFFVASLALDALGGALAGSACGVGASIVVEELFG